MSLPAKQDKKRKNRSCLDDGACKTYFTRSVSANELFTSHVSYSHTHTDLEGFVCPICGWCVPKSLVTIQNTGDKNYG